MNQLECYQVFKDQEMRIAPLLARIETTGILFNREALSNHKSEINARIEKIKADARDSVGYDVPLSSPKKLAEILFQKLHLAPEEKETEASKKGKTSKKNHESTAETVLIQLKDKHTLPGLILEYRHWAKLLSNWVDSLEKKAIFDEHDKTFKIKAHWDPLTATGRLASSEPNLQNLPKEDYAILDGDKPARVINVRNAFISREGYTLLSVDYSQIEMRILAHLCGDPALNKMIIAGEDIHKAVASIWLGKSAAHVTDSEREQAKEIGYGIIYGMGASGLGQKLKITTQQAQKLIHDFLQRFSAVQNFVRQTVNICKKSGSVKTLTNRRRLFDKINDRSNSTLASKQERQCVNTIIQGTAADLAKRTMVDLDDVIYADKISAYLIMQLHDELVYEVKLEEVDVLVNAIKKVIAKSGGLKMNVPTPVNISVGHSFGALVAYNK
jgi:DNA polymerase-1